MNLRSIEIPGGEEARTNKKIRCGYPSRGASPSGADAIFRLLSILLPAFLLAAPPAHAETEAPTGTGTTQKHVPKQAPKPAEALPAEKTAPGHLGSIDLRGITLNDAARLISQVGQVNVVVSSKISDRPVSLYLRNASVEAAIRALSRSAGVWYRYDAPSQTWLILNAEEYQHDIEITQDEHVRVFTLRHHNVVSAANAVQALFGPRVKLAEPVEEMPPVSLGSSRRTSGGGSSSTTTGGNGNSGGGSSSRGGGSGGGGDDFGGFATVSRSGGGSRTTGVLGEKDPIKLTGKEIEQFSPERIDSMLRTDASGRVAVDAGELLDGITKKQGLPIHLTYNRLHNLLLVRTGDGKAVEQIEGMLKKFDLPPVQVLLELKILDITLDDGFRSIFDIGFSSKGSTRGPFGAGGTTDGSSSGRLPNGNYPRDVGGLGNFDEDRDSTLVWQFMNDTIRLRLQMLQQQNRIQILATPMLVAANNQPARLFIGDEQVLVTGVSSQSITGTTGATNTTITAETERRDVGQILTILPRINGDRSVSLTIDQDSSKVKKGGSSVPLTVGSGDGAKVIDYPIDTVTTASLQVTAHAQDGLSVAIGGMINQTNGDQVEKVPLLGDIPLLGTMFKKTVRANLRSQLVLIVTPHVLDSPDRADFIAGEKSNEARVLRDKAKPPRRLPWPDDAPLPPETLLSPFTSEHAIPVVEDPAAPKVENESKPEPEMPAETAAHPMG